MKITIFYGPKEEFEKILPNKGRPKTLTKLIRELDEERKSINVRIEQQENKTVKKKKIKNLVSYYDEYSMISNSAINSFVSVLSERNIQEVFLQNPPVTIVEQLKSYYPNIIEEKNYSYKVITEESFKKMINTFDDTIMGQRSVGAKLEIFFYQMVKKYNKEKPLVLLFYGPAGVGKTETVKFIANCIGETLFRKQFSMYQNNSFAEYVFGEEHSATSLGKDLLNRASNVILFDEFDKAPSVFFSAFYQMFDEGIFSDKNYNVNLKNSIIICTTNFNDENEIEKCLGAPIYSRLDGCISFKELDAKSAEKILQSIFDEYYEFLDNEDKNYLDKEYVFEFLKNNISQKKNVREIKKIVKNSIFSNILKNRNENLIKNEELHNADTN